MQEKHKLSASERESLINDLAKTAERALREGSNIEFDPEVREVMARIAARRVPTGPQ